MCTDPSTAAGALRAFSFVSARRLSAAVLVAALAACAPRTVPPPQPQGFAHPEFVFPTVPAALQSTAEAAHIDAGWRYLQGNDLRSASREFAAALRSRPAFHPAHVGQGYVALADGDYADAVTAFDAALRASAAYVPALIGRGQALVELRRDDAAIASFEAALLADPSLSDVRLRVQSLRLRQLQDLIDTARRAAGDDRLAEARDAYVRALGASPESAFLHRELGDVERRAGDDDAALGHFARALELDRFDSESFVRIGEVFEARRDFAAAADAYRRAAAIDPSPDLNARIAAAEAGGREATLPAQFGAIAQSPQITRGDLAALIGTRLERVVQAAPQQPVVLTDVQDHWAEPWIVVIARTGVLAPFQNHLFEPAMPVRRMDLADAVRGLVTILAERDPALRDRLLQRPVVADVGAAHLSYPAVAAAVASGVMDLDNGRFDVARPVSGAEALATIERVRTLGGLR